MDDKPRFTRAYHENHAGDEPPLQLSERARFRELEREKLGTPEDAALLQ